MLDLLPLFTDTIRLCLLQIMIFASINMCTRQINRYITHEGDYILFLY